MEIEGVTNGCEEAGTFIGASAADVLDHHRAGGGSIALPQFLSVGSVIGYEIDRITDGKEGGRIATIAPAPDILDHHRAGGRPIALPQFGSVGSVIGSEIDRVSDRCKEWAITSEVETAATSAPDILDHHRA